MAGQFGGQGGSGPNFVIPKKVFFYAYQNYNDRENACDKSAEIKWLQDQDAEKFDKFGNIVKAKAEMGMTKEQQEEAKKRVLADLDAKIEISGLDIAGLREKIKSLHEQICKLEANQYDMEKRHERQEYDVSSFDLFDNYHPITYCLIPVERVERATTTDRPKQGYAERSRSRVSYQSCIYFKFVK